MLVWLYAQKIWFLFAFSAFFILLWAILCAFWGRKHPKAWQMLNGIFLCCTVLLIVYITLLRTSEARKELYLIPFNKLVLAQKNREYYREALTNAMLFIPFGMTCASLLPKQWGRGKRGFTACLLAFVLSAAIETLQYVFCLGTAETDDVITNSIGTFFGTAHLPLAAWLVRICQKHNTAETT